jgi:hypothetical protein
VNELTKESNSLHPLFVAVRETGAMVGVCKFCISATGGKPEDAINAGLPLDGEYNDHMSFANLVKAGYQVMTL